MVARKPKAKETPGKHLIAMGADWVHWPHAGERGTIPRAVLVMDADDFDPASALGDSDGGSPRSAPAANAPAPDESAGDVRR